MATSEEQFIREFNSFTKLSKPSVHGMPTGVEIGVPVNEPPLGPLVKVGGVPSDHGGYSDLNGIRVMLSGKRIAPQRPVLDRTGKRKVGLDGKLVLEDVVTPHKSVWVLSKTKVDIPFKAKYTGYDYSAPIMHDGVTYYMYCLPRSVVYDINLCALAISTKKLKSYNTTSISTWKNGKLYLSVIPWRFSAEYTNTKVIAVKEGTDFREEASKWVHYCVSQMLIPHAPDFDVADGNLVISDVPADLSEDSYVAVSPLSIDDLRTGVRYSSFEEETDIG